MPKERVYGKSYPDGTPPWKDLVVTWSKSEAEPNFHGAHGEGLVNVYVVEPTEDNLIEAISATLDRAGCNRLIKVVRRARDQAYGRDE